MKNILTMQFTESTEFYLQCLQVLSVVNFYGWGCCHGGREKEKQLPWPGLLST